MSKDGKFSQFFSLLLEPVVGYTRAVWLIKNGLWIIAAFLVAWLLVMPFLNPVHERFSLNFSSIEKTANDKPKMLNPRFQGLDSSNQPFYVTADSATQESDSKVILDKVNGETTTKDGGWVSVLANDGIVYTEKDELHLFHDVQLYTGDGYEFRTEKAIVYMNENVIEGDEPVVGQGATGTIHAKSFRVEDGGKRIVFKRDVKLKIYPTASE